MKSFYRVVKTWILFVSQALIIKCFLPPSCYWKMKEPLRSRGYLEFFRSLRYLLMKIIVGSPNLFPFCILNLLHYDMMASVHTLGLRFNSHYHTNFRSDNVLGYKQLWIKGNFISLLVDYHKHLFVQGKGNLQSNPGTNLVIYNNDLPIRYTHWCNNGTNVVGK